MKFGLKDLKDLKYYNHLAFSQRFRIFFTSKKRRFFLIFVFIMTFNFTANFAGFFMARVERSARKYKKNWIIEKNPKLMTY